MSDQTVIPSNQLENTPQATIEVTLRHHGVEHKIIGTPDGVIHELLAYFTKVFPSVELVSKLILTSDSSEFLNSCTGILESSQEGLAVLKDVRSLRAKELL